MIFITTQFEEEFVQNMRIKRVEEVEITETLHQLDFQSQSSSLQGDLQPLSLESSLAPFSHSNPLWILPRSSPLQSTGVTSYL